MTLVIEFLTFQRDVLASLSAACEAQAVLLRACQAGMRDRLQLEWTVNTVRRARKLGQSNEVLNNFHTGAYKKVKIMIFVCTCLWSLLKIADNVETDVRSSKRV